MPILGVLIVIIQVLFAVHAVRSGKDTFWIWIIIGVPGLGCLLYFLTQILPELLGSRTAAQAKTRLVKAVDPQRELRARMEQLQVANTTQNKLLLADECMEAGLFSDAVNLLEQCLVGQDKNEPNIMERLAFAYFEKADPANAKKTLDDLIRSNPDYKSTDGHLLYARSLEALELYDDAKREYEVLLESYPGEQARVRFALMLKSQGDVSRADSLFSESLERSKRAPKHYREREKEWLRLAAKG